MLYYRTASVSCVVMACRQRIFSWGRIVFSGSKRQLNLSETYMARFASPSMCAHLRFRISYTGNAKDNLIYISGSSSRYTLLTPSCTPQYWDLMRIFKFAGYPSQHQFLFLGDYVDRGMQGLECICLLLAYKVIITPSICVLDRGM